MTVVHPFPPPAEGGPYIAGRSAWTKWGHILEQPNYRYGSLTNMDGTRVDTPEHLAVRHATFGIQRIINAFGYRHSVLGPIPVTGKFGPRTKWGVQWVQRQNGLVEDGILGRITARAMFVPTVKYFAGGAIGLLVPAVDVLGMIDLESSWDPGAVSTWYKPANGPDRGLAQINAGAHSYVTDAQAFDPLFAITYAVGRLYAARQQFAGKGPELQRDCSIAQHNNPAGARAWYERGYISAADPLYLYVERVQARGALLV